MKTLSARKADAEKLKKVKEGNMTQRKTTLSHKINAVQPTDVNQSLISKIAESLKGKSLFSEQTEKAKHFIANAKFEL